MSTPPQQPGSVSPLPDNSLRNVIVNFLPPEWTEADLQKHFKGFGEIESLKLVREKGSQNSKCFGFIVFCAPESAKQCITQSNGLQVNGKRLKVALANPPNGHKNVNVYVCGLKRECTVNDLKDVYSAFGNVESVNILEQSKKGEGFVRFATEEEAEKAIAETNGKPLVRPADGAVVCDVANVKFANKARPKGKQPVGATGMNNVVGGMGSAWTGYSPMSMPGFPAPAPTSVFVYNIPSNVDEQTLYMLFSMYGSIQSMHMMKNPDGSFKGYGFVNYWNYYEAVQAITHLNGFHLMNKILQVRFKDPQKRSGSGGK
eukprot:PhF_6_TR20484/c1_g1_i1/m.29493/K13208/ELAVL2_3_4; ELAV like protein 2/3/4